MSSYLELSSANAGAYFDEVLAPRLPAGSQFLATNDVTELSQVNWVTWIGYRQPDGLASSLFVKQSRDYIKKYPDQHRSATRIGAEARTLDWLSDLVPGLVAEVVYFDEANHAIAMTDVIASGHILFNELRKGRTHPEASPYLGTVLATIQLATFGKRLDEILGPGIEVPTATSTAVTLGNRREAALGIYPDLTHEILAQVDGEGLRALVLGDVTPTNTVVDGQGGRLMDFERTAVGDPAIDLSRFFSSHLIETPADKLAGSIESIRAFMTAYLAKLSEKLERSELDRLQNRVVRMLGLMLLHRTRGNYFVIDMGEDKDLWQKRAEHLMQDRHSVSVEAALASLAAIAA